jgi:hypothetical protein
MKFNDRLAVFHTLAHPALSTEAATGASPNDCSQ